MLRVHAVTCGDAMDRAVLPCSLRTSRPFRSKRQVCRFLQPATKGLNSHRHRGVCRLHIQKQVELNHGFAMSLCRYAFLGVCGP